MGVININSNTVCFNDLTHGEAWNLGQIGYAVQNYLAIGDPLYFDTDKTQVAYYHSANFSSDKGSILFAGINNSAQSICSQVVYTWDSTNNFTVREVKNYGTVQLTAKGSGSALLTSGFQPYSYVMAIYPYRWLHGPTYY